MLECVSFDVRLEMQVYVKHKKLVFSNTPFFFQYPKFLLYFCSISEKLCVFLPPLLNVLVQICIFQNLFSYAEIIADVSLV